MIEETLSTKVKRFACGKLDEKDALNLLGEILAKFLGDNELITVTIQGNNFIIPKYDSVEFTYVGGGASDDDLVETQVFKLGSDTVSTLTYAYVGATNNIASITQS